MVVLALGCLPSQKTVAFDSCARETWRAANQVRNVLGNVGQCIAGYMLYETGKKAGMHGVINMLTSREFSPLACVFMGSCLADYVIPRSLDKYEDRVNFSAEAISTDTWKFFDFKEKCKFVSCVAARWLWLASVLYFLKVAQPLSVSASTSRMFA